MNKENKCVYVIKGETGETYNGTYDSWIVGSTTSYDEAVDWVDKANDWLKSIKLHTSSKDTHRAYKRAWNAWFDPEFRSTYNGATYFWYPIPELINYFKD